MQNREFKFRDDTIILQGDSHSMERVITTIQHDIPDGWDYVMVGDFGAGFGETEYAISNTISHLELLNERANRLDINVYIIRGNHDRSAIWKLPNVYSNVTLVNTGDIGVFPNGKRVLFIGGGVSVDRYSRKEGRDYWKDEITETLEDVPKVDIVFSHDCPEHFNHSTHSLPRSFGWYCDRDVTLIDDCLKQRKTMSDIVEKSGAKTTFYGHFHNSIQEEKDGVYARCIDINELVQFDANEEYKL